jgi:hypothetical protein
MPSHGLARMGTDKKRQSSCAHARRRFGNVEATQFGEPLKLAAGPSAADKFSPRVAGMLFAEESIRA